MLRQQLTERAAEQEQQEQQKQSNQQEQEQEQEQEQDQSKQQQEQHHEQKHHHHEHRRQQQQQLLDYDRNSVVEIEDDDDDDSDQRSHLFNDDGDDEIDPHEWDTSSDEETPLLHRTGRMNGEWGSFVDSFRQRKKTNKKDSRASALRFLKPVLSPLIKLYKITKEAVVLVTNVDNVWGSPAYETDDRYHRGTSASGDINLSVRFDVVSGQQYRSDGGALLDGDDFTEFGNPRQSSIRSGSSRSRTVSYRHKLGVLFWFLVLAITYATERGSFKVLVDRAGPFRMVIGAEVSLAVHTLVSGGIFLVEWLMGHRKGNDDTLGMMMLPVTDIGLMAILDTTQLLLAVISGAHVAPTLTVILIHFTIPLTTIFTQCSRPGGPCPRVTQNNDLNNPHQNHDNDNNNTGGGMNSQIVFGSTLVLLSTVLALSPAILTLVYPDYFPPSNIMADRTAWNTVVFVISCIPGAASQVYKERAMAAFAYPVDPTLLNFFLSTLSLGFATLVSPLFYFLQGLADVTAEAPGTNLKPSWWINLYPSTQISRNTSDGLRCLLGTLDDQTQENGYPDPAHCDFAYGIVLLHVLSTLSVHYAIHKICNAGAFKIMHRGFSAGIILSVACMMYYHVFFYDVDNGFLPNSWHITCAVVLLMGSGVYHSASLEEPSFETKYLDVAHQINLE